MSQHIEEYTPKQIVAMLDRHIVGQAQAKRAVAIALRNRYRRQQVPLPDRDDIMPKNILMMGPTGVGKTEIARRLAQIARAPFIKVEATKFTEVGYVGRDVESMVRELVAAAVRLVEQEKRDEFQPQADEYAYQRVLDMLDSSTQSFIYPTYDADGTLIQHAEAPPAIDRDKLLQEIKDGAHNETKVTIEVEEAGTSFLQVFTPQGMEEMGLDLPGLNNQMNSRRGWREVTVPEALATLVDQELKRLMERAGIHKEAVIRAEEDGIIFLDEIDKVAIPKSGGGGPEVSREGVQRDLLPIIEGSTVQTKFGPVRTDHVLFIAAGAFHMSQPSDLIPELQGRLPIRVTLDALDEDAFKRILTEPANALPKQYQKLLSVEGVTLEFEDAALDEVAFVAQEANVKLGNIGARRLHTMMELLLEDELFAAPDDCPKHVKLNVEDVRKRLKPILD